MLSRTFKVSFHDISKTLSVRLGKITLFALIPLDLLQNSFLDSLKWTSAGIIEIFLVRTFLNFH